MASAYHDQTNDGMAHGLVLIGAVAAIVALALVGFVQGFSRAGLPPVGDARLARTAGPDIRPARLWTPDPVIAIAVQTPPRHAVMPPTAESSAGAEAGSGDAAPAPDAAMSAQDAATVAPDSAPAEAPAPIANPV